MNFKDMVRQNRSVRGYDETRRVTREELLDLADCARLCPSSINMQPFKYRLVYEREEVDRLQPLTHWARKLPEANLPHEGKRPAAFIVICQDTRIFESLARFQKDVGIVAQTMLLGAVEKGLGGCMIGNFGAGSVKEALGLPEYLAPLLIVAFGKPDETIVLTEIGDGGSTDYYRDGQDIHYVPKRRLEDIVL